MAVHFREFVYIILELSEAMKVDGYRLMTIRQYSANMGKSANFDHETYGKLVATPFWNVNHVGIKGA